MALSSLAAMVFVDRFRSSIATIHSTIEASAADLAAKTI
jgi:hypothetical protein